MKKKLLLLAFVLISVLGKAQTPADALNFDGTNDYVLLPPSLPSLGTTDCTFEAWVYPKLYIAGTASLQMILAKDQWGDGNSEFRLCIVSGFFRFSMGDITHANYLDLSSPVYPINNWYHIAAVRQGTVHTLYVNGAVVATGTTAAVINSNNPAHPWSIGCRKLFSPATDPLNGSIDELRIWNVARTKCEINTFMNCEIPTTATGLIANFHFNQGVASGANSTVTTLTDYSGGANTGTLTNFALTGASSNWVSPGGVIAGSITPLPPINVTANASNTLICSNATTTLSGSGAHSYIWTGGAMNGFAFSPSVTASYTVTGTNSLTGCSNTAVTSVSVIPSPTVTVNSGNLCLNSNFTLTPAGAVSYIYSSGSAIVSPTINTSYTVTGTAANGCTGKAVSNVSVLPVPNITPLVSQTAVCQGQPVALNAIGAVTYSWNGVLSASNITVSPITSTAYVVTGAGANLCESSKTVNILVYPLPNLTISPISASYCLGEKIKLTASGATSYTWNPQGSITTSVQLQPTVTTSYTLNGESSQNCVNSKTFQIVISPCTGISQLANEQVGLIIYPNPSNGSFSIKTEDDLTLNLVNDIGQLVKRIYLTSENDHTFYVSELSTGIYFLLGNNGAISINEKIIVSN